MLLAFVMLALQSASTPPSAAEIMSRVAANQDREQAERNQFVYERKVHRTLRTKTGKLLRDENWVFAMTPGLKGTDMKLISVKGRYWKRNQYLMFDGLPIPTVGVLEVTLDLTTDTNSRDAIDKDLFPLTTDEQQKYTFGLLGERAVRGRQAYDIQFRPINKRDFGWMGEALIDKEEFQPISVHTQLSRKVPVVVRTALGTNVHGVGYNIEYTRVDKKFGSLALTGPSTTYAFCFFMTGLSPNQ
jgi:hypothetical protein